MKYALLASAASAAFVTFEGGPEFDITWDAAKNGGRMKFQASVDNNKWLGLSFGGGMDAKDMVLFQARGDNGEVSDLWSTAKGVAPTKDSNQNYEDQQRSKSGNTYKFTTWRKLDTGDAVQDWKFECGKSYDMAWSANSKTADFQQHDSTDVFKMAIAAAPDCTIVLSSAVYKAMGLLTVASSLYLM